MNQLLYVRLHSNLKKEARYSAKRGDSVAMAIGREGLADQTTVTGEGKLYTIREYK